MINTSPALYCTCFVTVLSMLKRLKSAIAVFVFEQSDFIFLWVSAIHTRRTVCKDYVMNCLSILYKTSLDLSYRSSIEFPWWVSAWSSTLCTQGRSKTFQNGRGARGAQGRAWEEGTDWDSKWRLTIDFCTKCNFIWGSRLGWGRVSARGRSTHAPPGHATVCTRRPDLTPITHHWWHNVHSQGIHMWMTNDSYMRRWVKSGGGTTIFFGEGSWIYLKVGWAIFIFIFRPFLDQWTRYRPMALKW